MGSEPGLGAVSLLFSGQGQSGDALACGSSDSTPRYDRWYSSDMKAAGALLNTRSVTVFATVTGASTLLLFSQSAGDTNFGGDFFQITNAHPSLQCDRDIPDGFYWPGPPTLPKPYSMLVLQTQRSEEIRVSAAGTFTGFWDDFVSTLPEEVILKGPPTLTWSAFPRNEQFLSEDHIYLSIYQAIEIDFSDFWPNYVAYFKYWLHLHNTDGVVTGHVARWHYWVEGGVFTKVVKAILEPNLKLGIFAIEDALSQKLSKLPSDITGIYY